MQVKYICKDVYTVQSGDTLYTISQNYNVHIGLLMRVNKIINPYNLRIGMRLCIPAPAEEAPMPETMPMQMPETIPETMPMPEIMPEPMPEITPIPMPAPMPEVEPIPMPMPEVEPIPMPELCPAPRPERPRTRPAPSPGSPCSGTMYTIVRGDTLYMIAKRRGISLKKIIDANPDIDPYNMMAGDRICIPR